MSMESGHFYILHCTVLLHQVLFLLLKRFRVLRHQLWRSVFFREQTDERDRKCLGVFFC